MFEHVEHVGRFYGSFLHKNKKTHDLGTENYRTRI